MKAGWSHQWLSPPLHPQTRGIRELAGHLGMLVRVSQPLYQPIRYRTESHHMYCDMTAKLYSIPAHSMPLGWQRSVTDFLDLFGSALISTFRHRTLFLDSWVGLLTPIIREYSFGSFLCIFSYFSQKYLRLYNHLSTHPQGSDPILCPVSADGCSHSAPFSSYNTPGEKGCFRSHKRIGKRKRYPIREQEKGRHIKENQPKSGKVQQPFRWVTSQGRSLRIPTASSLIFQCLSPSLQLHQKQLPLFPVLMLGRTRFHDGCRTDRGMEKGERQIILPIILLSLQGSLPEHASLTIKQECFITTLNVCDTIVLHIHRWDRGVVWGCVQISNFSQYTEISCNFQSIPCPLQSCEEGEFLPCSERCCLLTQ